MMSVFASLMVVSVKQAPYSAIFHVVTLEVYFLNVLYKRGEQIVKTEFMK